MQIIKYFEHLIVISGNVLEFIPVKGQKIKQTSIAISVVFFFLILSREILHPITH